MKALEKYLFGEETITLDEKSISGAIARLPGDNQKVITLHFIDKLPRKEIACQLNWSPTKVHNKLTRGITLLKHDLNPKHFDEMIQLRTIAAS